MCDPPRHRLQQGRTRECRVIKDDARPRDAAQLTERLPPVGCVHQNAQANHGVEGTVRTIQLVRVILREGHADFGKAGIPPRNDEHLGGCVHARHNRATVCQCNRGATGAGSDVQNRAAGNGIKECGDHLLLRGRDETPDRPAESHPLEGFRHRGIRIHRVAVVIARRITHAVPLAT